MAFIQPTRERYDPERDLRQPFQGWAKCIRVEQGLPNPRYAGKSNIAITFEVCDERYPELRGLRTAIVAMESVYLDPDTGKPSHLLAHARNMGIKDAEQGFDPQQFVGQLYHVTCEVVGDRAYVRIAIPAGVMAPLVPKTVERHQPADAPPIDGAPVTDTRANGTNRRR